MFVPKIAERFDVDLTLRELTALNAMRKGLSAARQHPKNIVLAADTLVAIGNHILGKPKNKRDAVAMLHRLSGRAHEVCSTVFICELAGAKSVSFSELSHDNFRRLSRAKIDNYVKRVDPLDKAGAYTAQGFGADIIEKIDGSYTNVIGLPMERAVSALAEFGIEPKAE